MGSAEETRARILDAAAVEFADHGIAGARVRAIAASAQVNMQRIYAYFGDKQNLYLEVMERSLSQVAAAVPIDANDIPGYVARLYDYLIANEQLGRLGLWGQLEGVHRDLKDDHPRMANYVHKLDAIRAAQDAGAIDDSWHETDLFALLTAIANAWRRVSDEVKQIDHRRYESDAAAHRQAAIEAAIRLVEPRLVAAGRPVRETEN